MGLGLGLRGCGCVVVFPVSAKRHGFVRGDDGEDGEDDEATADESNQIATRRAATAHQGRGGRRQRRATALGRREADKDVVPLVSLCQLKLKQLSQRHLSATALSRGLRWIERHFCWRGPILNPSPVLDSSAQTTRGNQLDFFCKT